MNTIRNTNLMILQVIFLWIWFKIKR